MGFRIRETMMGTHEFHNGAGARGQHPFGFEVTWGPERLREWLSPTSARFMWQELEGKVLIGGLTGWVDCRGTLDLQYFSKQRIRYCFDAEVQGTIYRYVGEKVNIHPLNLPVSHTTCFGHLTELSTGKLISTSVVTFKMRDLWSFVRSVKAYSGGRG